MTDLRACYFCGTAEAAEEGPAIPPAMDPPEAVQQSVVLCPACREKLTAVLEPVFGGGAGVAASGADAATDADTPDATGSDGTRSDDGGDDHGEEGMFGVFDAAGDDPTASTRGGEDTAPDPASTPKEEGAGGPRADAGAGPDADAPVDRIPDSGGAGGPGAGEPPEEYYTVLRFLENREFPVARGEIESTVAAAYELSEREVARIVDAAVDRGVLVEADGTLARSRDQL